MSLKGKVVIITGASSGIGKSCAIEFAKRGASVVLAGRRIVALCEITADIEQRFSTKALAVECDVTKFEDCEHLINSAKMAFGKIDILVNNAGISMRTLFQDLELQVVRDLMEVNFFGMINCTKLALEDIIANKGSIIGVSSINGFIGTPGRSAYSASKFAMNGFLDALRIELMDKGVHVMMVAPGFTASEIREKALLKDGKMQGTSHMNEAKLMSPDVVAKGIADGTEARKRDVIFTTKGKLALLWQKLFPSSLDNKVLAEFKKETNPLL